MSLHDQRLDDVVHLANLRSGLVDSFSGRSPEFLIFTLGEMGIIIVFMRNGTAVFLFCTAIADVGSFAPKAMNAEVVGVGKTALIPGIGAAVKAHLFGDGGRIFAKELGDVLERETLVKGFLDVYPVIQRKVFLVTRY